MSWPSKGDKAFRTAKDGEHFHLSGVNWPYPRIAEAFKEAAEMLIDAHQDPDHRRHNYHDELFFPIAYLYRHCLELRLKDIVRIGVGLSFFKETEVREVLDGHSLARAWSKAKALLLHRWSGCDPAPVQSVEAVISEFHRADPNGQMLRYPSDKEGREHEHKHLPKQVSIEHLSSTLNAVFSFLDATATELQCNLEDSSWQ